MRRFLLICFTALFLSSIGCGDSNSKNNGSAAPSNGGGKDEPKRPDVNPALIDPPAPDSCTVQGNLKEFRITCGSDIDSVQIKEVNVNARMGKFRGGIAWDTGKEINIGQPQKRMIEGDTVGFESLEFTVHFVGGNTSTVTIKSASNT